MMLFFVQFLYLNGGWCKTGSKGIIYSKRNVDAAEFENKYEWQSSISDLVQEEKEHGQLYHHKQLSSWEWRSVLYMRFFHGHQVCLFLMLTSDFDVRILISLNFHRSFLSDLNEEQPMASPGAAEEFATPDARSSNDIFHTARTRNSTRSANSSGSLPFATVSASHVLNENPPNETLKL